MTFDLDKWRWWTETLEYVRTISGKIYRDQLFRLSKENYQKYFQSEIPTTEENIVDYLNQNTPTCMAEIFLKVDPVTDGIYTVPSQRVTLDALLYAANENYVYNPCLYMDTPENMAATSEISFAQLQEKPFFQEVFRLSGDMELTIDLTALRKHKIYGFRSFCLDEIAEYFLNSAARPDAFHFGKINACQMIFFGKTQLGFSPERIDLPTLSSGVCFSEATFCGSLHVENLVFSFDNKHSGGKESADNKLDFRNARFFDAVSFRDVRLTGDTADTELTFEDARIQEEISFVNVDFGNANIYFFQTVVGDFVSYVDAEPRSPAKPRKVQFKNIDISDASQIDFSDAEMTGAELVFENIPSFPQAKLCLAPAQVFKNGVLLPGYCPQNYLLIRNCEICRTLYIGNVAELSFQDSYNYSKIVGASNWGAFPGGKAYRSTSRGLGGTYISNPLLRAVYNNKHLLDSDNATNELAYAKAKDFIMLKENFCSLGKYDEEDEAFILYMEFKPYINSTLLRKKKSQRKKPYKDLGSNFLYKCLYAFGKYGISPGRVVFALLIMVLTFGLLYFIAACTQGINAFSLNGTLHNVWNYADPAAFNSSVAHPLLLNLLVSFLYSIEGVIPFVSQFEPISLFVCILTVAENALGSFLVGYFSVAVVRKTLR